MNFYPDHKMYWPLVVVMTLMALFLTVWGEAADHAVFFGVPLVVLVVVAGVVGGIALKSLTRPLRFQVWDQRNRRQGLVFAFIAALTFGVIIVFADMLFPFSDNINVPLPEAFLFYPVAGFIVECLFHLLPLALLLWVFQLVIKEGEGTVLAILALLITALIEPAFQSFAPFANQRDGPPAMFLFLHILAINLTGLWFFARYGFVTMFVFRLFYYLHWHILWGYLRLQF